MQQMCPQCDSPLQAIIAEEDGVQRQVRWCMACSYVEDKPSKKRTNIPSAPDSVLRIRAQIAGPWDEKKYRKWELFEAVLRNYDADGVELTNVYRNAKALPGQWVVTAAPVTRWQLVRALLGRSWETCEPPMAIRCNVDGSVDLAFNAYKVMTRKQALPTWWDLVRNGWRVQYYDPA